MVIFRTLILNFMKTNPITFLAICFLIYSSTIAQVTEVGPPNFIKTIIFKSTSQQSQCPIFKLGEPFKLEFDAINANEEDYYYKIEHFNFDWTPSQLAKSEYLNGYDEQRIRNYENSFNTYQIYSHYKLAIPNQRTRGLKKSGNYIVSVYNDDDTIIFSRKFMVYQELCPVGVAVKRTREVANIDYKHAIDITINSPNIQLVNPKKTVKVQLIQNNNLNTLKTQEQPIYTTGNKLTYQFDKNDGFFAGNEFLYFENKDIRAANTGVKSIELGSDLYNTYLFTDVDRSTSIYTYNPDVNGLFAITMLDSNNPSIEADYSWVSFSLKKEKLPKNNQIYIVGNFNNYAINNDSRMDFNEEAGIYIKRLLLKQGFYNYNYVVYDANNNEIPGAISGNFYQTENNYKALVYYRPLGSRYDKIIGFGEGTSVNISN